MESLYAGIDKLDEYTVDNKKITLTITDQKTDPVPEGTKITLWVNPDNRTIL